MIEKIKLKEQATTIVTYLESVVKKMTPKYVSAPGLGLRYALAICRDPKFKIDLVNPKILKKENKIISLKEACSSLFSSRNCFRYKDIIVQNGLEEKIYKFSGQKAIIVQHLIDHIEEVDISKQTISLALVRTGGAILPTDYCPCGSRKKFSACHATTDITAGEPVEHSR